MSSLAAADDVRQRVLRHHAQRGGDVAELHVEVDQHRRLRAAAVSPMARLVETVVLPTPPLGEAMVMTRPV